MPDTSILLDRPNIQHWSKLTQTKATLVLLPAVLHELDERKHDPRTRDAALKVLRLFDTMDSRGDTFAGVKLSGKLSYRDVAISPDMTRTLPWLRPDVPDDQILAGALELGWHNLNASVAVAASDRNMQIKARMAGILTLGRSDL